MSSTGLDRLPFCECMSQASAGQGIDRSELDFSYYLSSQVSPSLFVEHVTCAAGWYNRCPDKMLLSFSLRQHSRSTYLIEGTELRHVSVNKGECCLVPKNRSIAFHSFEGIDCLNVFVDDDMWLSAASGFSHLLEHGITVRTGIFDPLLRQFSILLLEELENERPGGEVLTRSIVNALLVHLLRLHLADCPHTVMPSLPAWKVSLVRRYIDENISRELPLAELASVARLSTFHFARVFKEATGQSPHNFIVNRRLVAAEAMLAANELSIAQVAFLSGYGNQSHFTKIFVRHSGMTPKRFRQQSFEDMAKGASPCPFETAPRQTRTAGRRGPPHQCRTAQSS